MANKVRTTSLEALEKHYCQGQLGTLVSWATTATYRFPRCGSWGTRGRTWQLGTKNGLPCAASAHSRERAVFLSLSRLRSSRLEGPPQHHRERVKCATECVFDGPIHLLALGQTLGNTMRTCRTWDVGAELAVAIPGLRADGLAGSEKREEPPAPLVKLPDEAVFGFSGGMFKEEGARGGEEVYGLHSGDLSCFTTSIGTNAGPGPGDGRHLGDLFGYGSAADFPRGRDSPVLLSIKDDELGDSKCSAARARAWCEVATVCGKPTTSRFG